jgi:hypothetical protein
MSLSSGIPHKHAYSLQRLQFIGASVAPSTNKVRGAFPSRPRCVLVHARARVRLRNILQGLTSPPRQAKLTEPSPSRPLCGLASKLLLPQKTELPCLTTVCSGKPDTMLSQLLCIHISFCSFFAIRHKIYNILCPACLIPFSDQR